MSQMISSYMHAAFNQKQEKQKVIWSADYLLLAATGTLMILGLIMVGSASVSIAEDKLGDPFYYLWRQLSFTGVGLVAALITLRIPMRFWKEAGPALVVISLLLLLLVSL